MPGRALQKTAANRGNEAQQKIRIYRGAIGGKTSKILTGFSKIERNGCNVMVVLHTYNCILCMAPDMGRFLQLPASPFYFGIQFKYTAKQHKTV